MNHMPLDTVIVPDAFSVNQDIGRESQQQYSAREETERFRETHVTGSNGSPVAKLSPTVWPSACSSYAYK